MHSVDIYPTKEEKGRKKKGEKRNRKQFSKTNVQFISPFSSFHLLLLMDLLALIRK